MAALTAPAHTLLRRRQVIYQPAPGVFPRLKCAHNGLARFDGPGQHLGPSTGCLGSNHFSSLVRQIIQCRLVQPQQGLGK